VWFTSQGPFGARVFNHHTVGATQEKRGKKKGGRLVKQKQGGANRGSLARRRPRGAFFRAEGNSVSWEKKKNPFFFFSKGPPRKKGEEIFFGGGGGVPSGQTGPFRPGPIVEGDLRWCPGLWQWGKGQGKKTKKGGGGGGGASARARVFSS